MDKARIQRGGAEQITARKPKAAGRRPVERLLGKDVLPVYMDVLQAAKRLARQFKFRHFTVQLTPGKRPPEVVYDSATDCLTLFWGYSGGE